MYELYRDIARAYGLTLTPPNPDFMTFAVGIGGRLDGHDVGLVRVAGSGPFTLSYCSFAPPLDLGLVVTPASVFSPLAKLLGSQDVTIGYPLLDDAFLFRGHEEERVKALFGFDLCTCLQSLRYPPTEIADHRFESRIPYIEESHATLERMLQEALQVGQHMRAALRSVPCAAPLREHRAVCQGLAELHKLELTDTPLSLQGKIGHAFFTTRSALMSADEMALHLVLGVEQPLDAGISLAPARTVAEKLSGASRIGRAFTLGDGAFDTRFELRARDEARARTIFDEAFRARLVELSAFGQVWLDDKFLSLHATTKSLPADAFHAVVELMGGIIDARFPPTHAYR